MPCALCVNKAVLDKTVVGSDTKTTEKVNTKALNVVCGISYYPEDTLFILYFFLNNKLSTRVKQIAYF